MMKNSSTQAYLYVALALGTLALLAYLLTSLFKSNQQDLTALVIDNTATSSSSRALARDVPDGFREYKSEVLGFSLLYPKYLEVKERDEGGKARTITFQNIDKEEGFQIFAVPFASKQITPEQFKKDAPSGVREDLQDITVGGAVGASFHGFDIALGDTSEVWFIKEPYLYEVTTIRQNESLLQTIMNSWKFI